MIYGAYKQTHNQEEEIKVLSLSSNQKQLRFGIGVVFLDGFLMAWPKLCYEGRGKVSGRSEVVWHMK